VLGAYRPALYLITGVAAVGLLAVLPSLRRASSGGSASGSGSGSGSGSDARPADLAAELEVADLG
jgi:hypothetical protein